MLTYAAKPTTNGPGRLYISKLKTQGYEPGLFLFPECLESVQRWLVDTVFYDKIITLLLEIWTVRMRKRDILYGIYGVRGSFFME